MSGATQSLVAVGGLTLAGVNFWTGPQRPALSGLVWNGTTGTAARDAMLQLGGELALIFVMWAAAGASDGAANAMLMFIVGLWLLWAIHHFDSASLPLPAAHTPTPPTGYSPSTSSTIPKGSSVV